MISRDNLLFVNEILYAHYNFTKFYKVTTNLQGYWPSMRRILPTRGYSVHMAVNEERALIGCHCTLMQFMCTQYGHHTIT